MSSIASIDVIAFTMKSMVVFSSTYALDHDILPCIVSFGGEMLIKWGFHDIDGV